MKTFMIFVSCILLGFFLVGCSADEVAVIRSADGTADQMEDLNVKYLKTNNMIIPNGEVITESGSVNLKILKSNDRAFADAYNIMWAEIKMMKEKMGYYHPHIWEDDE